MEGKRGNVQQPFVTATSEAFQGRYEELSRVENHAHQIYFLRATPLIDTVQSYYLLFKYGMHGKLILCTHHGHTCLQN